MRPDELERRLRARLDALGPAPRAELLHVLLLPDFDRAHRIGSYWENPKTRTFAELLIGCEEDRVLRAVLVGMLRDRPASGVGEGVAAREPPGLVVDQRSRSARSLVSRVISIERIPASVRRIASAVSNAKSTSVCHRPK